MHKTLMLFVAVNVSKEGAQCLNFQGSRRTISRSDCRTLFPQKDRILSATVNQRLKSSGPVNMVVRCLRRYFRKMVGVRGRFLIYERPDEKSECSGLESHALGRIVKVVSLGEQQALALRSTNRPLGPKVFVVKPQGQSML